MALLTAAMFVKGYMVVALVSGVILTGMTAMALALFGLAWSMMTDEHEDEFAELPILTG